ncbi:hypothetical protein [Streptomyces sp. NPDC093223]|uniref:hypothetical protein n=1 Tax=Streptomyces sp. NPDC093223 TaxID=3366033 RepID=UPI0038190F13
MHPGDRRPDRWAADQVPLDDTLHLTTLLRMWRHTGAHEKAAALLARTPAAHHHVNHATADFMRELREACAHDQATALNLRFPAMGQYGQYIELVDSPERFRFGREPDGTPAPPWTWDDVE